MGDSRSHAAEMEDTIVTCIYGNEHKYYDDCSCRGCKDDRELGRLIDLKAREVGHIAAKVFRNIPREQWDSVVSIRIKP